MGAFQTIEHSELLRERVESIGHEVIEVNGDVNCFFTSLGFQIQNILQTSDCPEPVLSHFENLVISLSIASENMTRILRNLVVTEWISNPSMYNFNNTSLKNVVLEATLFQQSGH